MMKNVNKNPAVGHSEFARIPLKLAGLFAISFFLFLGVFIAYDLLAGFAERALRTTETREEPPPLVVDPRIADDLAKVLNIEPFQESTDIKDPFLDRAGLSGSANSSTSTNLVQSSATSPNSQQAASGRIEQPGKGNSAAGGSQVQAITPVEATKQRYYAWLERYGTTDSPLDPRVFAIEDLLPVGLVDGGNGQQEVLFLSQASGKTMSFPLGTLFFDGWLAELRPEGVVFTSNDDRRTMRMRSWARSVKSSG